MGLHQEADWKNFFLFTLLFPYILMLSPSLTTTFHQPLHMHANKHVHTLHAHAHTEEGLQVNVAEVTHFHPHSRGGIGGVPLICTSHSDHFGQSSLRSSALFTLLYSLPSLILLRTCTHTKIKSFLCLT